MFYEYTVHIMEEREDGRIYWCYEKSFVSKKKAISKAAQVVSKMTGKPTGVCIYKNIIGGFSVPESVFKYGDMSFHDSDFYLKG